MKVFRILIDLDRLRNSLSAENREETSEEAVLVWLREAGFYRTADGWLVREADLGQLQPAEVGRADILDLGGGDDGNDGDAAGDGPDTPATSVGLSESVLKLRQGPTGACGFNA